LTLPAPPRTLDAVRLRTLLTLSRRLLGAVLTVSICVASAAPHNHSFEELLGRPSAAGEHAVTTHDPHSRASHWHAVIRFVKETPCLACQWHRISGGFSQTGFAPSVLSVSRAENLVAATVRFAALGQQSSRAPPALL
jgi:hypothetical protein